MYPAYFVLFTSAVGLYATKRLWEQLRLARVTALVLASVLIGKVAMLVFDSPTAVLSTAILILPPIELATNAWVPGSLGSSTPVPPPPPMGTRIMVPAMPVRKVRRFRFDARARPPSNVLCRFFFFFLGRRCSTCWSSARWSGRSRTI